MKPWLLKQIPLFDIPKKRIGWGDRFKEKEVANAIRNESASYDVDVDKVLELAKNQREYQQTGYLITKVSEFKKGLKKQTSH